MESVLTELELDLREIKYLTDILSREPDSMLRKVAVRRVRQMQAHLDELLNEIDDETQHAFSEEAQSAPTHVVVPELEAAPEYVEESNPEPVAETESEPEPEPIVEDEPETASLQEEHTIEITETHTVKLVSLGDRVKPADLKSSFTLNDRFLFSRELFNSDMERMDTILLQISQMESLNNVLVFLDSALNTDSENEIYADFVERIRKYFE